MVFKRNKTKWKPPTSWKQNEHTFAPLIITADNMSVSVRKRYGNGGSFLLDTPRDTVHIFRSLERERLRIDDVMSELFKEQLRIAQACGQRTNLLTADERLKYTMKVLSQTQE